MSSPIEFRIKMNDVGQGTVSIMSDDHGYMDITKYVRGIAFGAAPGEMTTVTVEFIRALVEFDGPAMLVPYVHAPSLSADAIRALPWKEIEQEALEGLGMGDSMLDAIRTALIRRLESGTDLDKVAAFVETLMVDECIIVRKGRLEEVSEPTWNEDTGTYDEGRVPSSVMYEGPCFFYVRRVDSQPVADGGQERPSMQLYASLPLNVDYEIQPEDELTVVDAQDEAMIGKTFFVEIADQGTYRATREVALLDRSQAYRT